MINEKLKTILYTILILGIILFLVANFWYVISFSKSKPPTRTFSIQGEGRVLGVPDVAEISLGVVVEGGKDISELQKENAQKVNEIVSFLRNQGIKEEDIQTSFYNISPRYSKKKSNIEDYSIEEIIGYKVEERLTVKIKDLEATGRVLAGAVDRGANLVSGPSFKIEDIASLQKEAREIAIKKAKEKAQNIAEIAGFGLGKLVSIAEHSVPPLPIRATSSREGISIPIEPGSQEIKVSVTLTYEIK